MSGTVPVNLLFGQHMSLVFSYLPNVITTRPCLLYGIHYLCIYVPALARLSSSVISVNVCPHSGQCWCYSRPHIQLVSESSALLLCPLVNLVLDSPCCSSQPLVLTPGGSFTSVWLCANVQIKPFSSPLGYIWIYTPSLTVCYITFKFYYLLCRFGFFYTQVILYFKNTFSSFLLLGAFQNKQVLVTKKTFLEFISFQSENLAVEGAHFLFS